MTRRRGPRTAHGARAPSITWRRARRRGGAEAAKGGGSRKNPLGRKGFSGKGIVGWGIYRFSPGSLENPLGRKGIFGGNGPQTRRAFRGMGGTGIPIPGPPSHEPRHAGGGGNAPSAPKARPGKVEEGGPVAKSLCAQRDFRAGKTRGGEFTVPTGDAWKTLCAIKDFFEEKRFWPPDP